MSAAPRTGASRRRLADIARRAMRERGLLAEFSPAALAELDAITPPPADASVRDLRELRWASIDNDESRDLDQLSASRSLADGSARILVAIADVDALVQQGGAIDRHARTNTTSVYTAAEVFHMLPQRLSTDLTSMNEGVDRLAVVVEFTVAADGGIADPAIYRALVHNRAKLAYDSVAAWLDGSAAIPAALAAVPGLDEDLRLQCRVAQSMRRRRHRLGALTLKLVQARPVFENGVLVDLRAEEPNAAKQMIEEFMIAANSLTAGYLEEQGFPSIRRVLRAPARWDRIVALAAGFGETLPPQPDAVALQAFLLKRCEAEPERFSELSVSVVKLLGGGEYAVDGPGQRAEGHFGLAVSDYTHSTAPNRRYADLVTQRLLKAAIAGRDMPYSMQDLQGLARHITLQDDNANKVERQVRKSAAAVLLEHRRGEVFDAMVTGASNKGTWVRIFRPAGEGRVVEGSEGLDVGDRIRVRLVATDVERGFIDFALVKS